MKRQENLQIQKIVLVVKVCVRVSTWCCTTRECVLLESNVSIVQV